MSETVLQRLERKIAEASRDGWSHKHAVAIVLDPGTHYDPRVKTLSGGIRFSVQGSDGGWRQIHHERIDQLSNDDDIDDVLASGLSRLLMKHTEWPR
jgi:hypothetical protein